MTLKDSAQATNRFSSLHQKYSKTSTGWDGGRNRLASTQYRQCSTDEDSLSSWIFPLCAINQCWRRRWCWALLKFSTFPPTWIHPSWVCCRKCRDVSNWSGCGKLYQIFLLIHFLIDLDEGRCQKRKHKYFKSFLWRVPLSTFNLPKCSRLLWW